MYFYVDTIIYLCYIITIKREVIKYFDKSWDLYKHLIAKVVEKLVK